MLRQKSNDRKKYCCIEVVIFSTAVIEKKDYAKGFFSFIINLQTLQRIEEDFR
jgi:hypothetical protein